MPFQMLTTGQCSAVGAAIERLQDSRPRGAGHLFPYATRVAFPELARRFPDIPELPLKVAGLMALIGPVEGGPPPQVLQQDLSLRVEWILRATHAKGLKPDDLMVQLGLAYGCGWRRSIRNVRQPLWDSPWPDAVKELILHAVGITRRLCHRLEGAAS